MTIRAKLIFIALLCITLFTALSFYLLNAELEYQLRFDPSTYYNLTLDRDQMLRYNRLEEIITDDYLVMSNQNYNLEFSLFILFHSVNALYNLTQIAPELTDRTVRNIEIAVGKAIEPAVYNNWYFHGFCNLEKVNTVC